MHLRDLLDRLGRIPGNPIVVLEVEDVPDASFSIDEIRDREGFIILVSKAEALVD